MAFLVMSTHKKGHFMSTLSHDRVHPVVPPDKMYEGLVDGFIIRDPNGIKNKNIRELRNCGPHKL